MNLFEYLVLLTGERFFNFAMELTRDLWKRGFEKLSGPK